MNPSNAFYTKLVQSNSLSKKKENWKDKELKNQWPSKGSIMHRSEQVWSSRSMRVRYRADNGSAREENRSADQNKKEMRFQGFRHWNGTEFWALDENEKLVGFLFETTSRLLEFKSDFYVAYGAVPCCEMGPPSFPLLFMRIGVHLRGNYKQKFIFNKFGCDEKSFGWSHHICNIRDVNYWPDLIY
jgi:hypothetical protein